MSTNPARLLNVEGGSLEVNKLADIVVFDEEEKWMYTIDKVVSKSKNSPFIGKELTGKVKFTICNGKIVFEG
jgi:dihydroorotase